VLIARVTQLQLLPMPPSRVVPHLPVTGPVVYLYVTQIFFGTLSTVCTNGNWVLLGSCALEAQCTSQVGVVNGGPGNCVVDVFPGAVCTPACSTGFFGSITANCTVAGSWSVVGSCASSACATPPSSAHVGAGDCQTGAASGTTCTPVCGPGFIGNLTATCTTTAWTINGTCVPTSSVCLGTPNLPDGALLGNCSADAALGTTCVPVCKTPKSNSSAPISAVCQSTASWAVTGDCGGSRLIWPIIVGSVLGFVVVTTVIALLAYYLINSGAGVEMV